MCFRIRAVLCKKTLSHTAHIMYVVQLFAHVFRCSILNAGMPLPRSKTRKANTAKAPFVVGGVTAVKSVCTVCNPLNPLTVDPTVCMFPEASVQYASSYTPPTIYGVIGATIDMGIRVRWYVPPSPLVPAPQGAYNYVQKTFMPAAFMDVNAQGVPDPIKIDRGRIAFFLTEIDAGCAVDGWAHSFKGGIAAFEANGAILSRTTHQCIYDDTEEWRHDFLMTRVGMAYADKTNEPIPGYTISRYTATDLPAASIVQLACDAYRALAVLHALGVVHNDLHTGNVMINKFGGGSILDYGLGSRIALTPGTTDLTHEHLRDHHVFVPEFQVDAATKTTRVVLAPSADVWQLGLSILMFARARYPALPKVRGAAKTPVLPTVENGELLLDLIENETAAHIVMWNKLKTKQEHITHVLDNLERRVFVNDSSKAWIPLIKGLRAAMWVDPKKRATAAEVALLMKPNAFEGMPTPNPYDTASYKLPFALDTLAMQYAYNYNMELNAEAMRLTGGVFLMYRASRYGAFLKMITRAKLYLDSVNEPLKMEHVHYIQRLVTLYMPDRQEYVGHCSQMVYTDASDDNKLMEFAILVLKGRLFDSNIGTVFIYMMRHLYIHTMTPIWAKTHKPPPTNPSLKDIAAFYTAYPMLFDIMNDIWERMYNNEYVIKNVWFVVRNHYAASAGDARVAFAPATDLGVHESLYATIFNEFAPRSQLYNKWVRNGKKLQKAPVGRKDPISPMQLPFEDMYVF